MSTPSNAETFSIRNINCDFYFAEAHQFPSTELPADFTGRVPILRIFGITTDGKKCCAHIHDCFPYIWIRTKLPLNSSSSRQLSRMVSSLITQIPDLCKDPEGPVLKISDSLCKSLYGYCDADEYFAKISLRDPRYVKFLANGLQKLALSNHMAQPFSAHVPYILQFFIDHSVVGMGLVHFDQSQIKFRRLPASDGGVYVKSTLNCTTKMDVEFDASVGSLRNSVSLSKSPFVNTGLELVYVDERERRGSNGTPLPISSPDDGRTPAEVLPVEQKFLDQLRAFCEDRRAQTEDLNGTLNEAETLRANTTVVDESFLESMNAIVSDYRDNPGNFANFNEGGRWTEVEEQAESPMWDDLEMQMRGFEAEEEEEVDGNEEILTDSDEMDDDEVPDDSDWRDFGQEDVCAGEMVQPSHAGVCSVPIANPTADHDLHEPVVLKRRRRCLPKPWHEATLTASYFQSQPALKLPDQPSRSARPTKSAVPHLCAMALEVLALPSSASVGVATPATDPIIAVGVAVCDDVVNWDAEKFSFELAIVVTEKQPYGKKNVMFVENETRLLNELGALVSNFNPDVLIGYDLVRGSWTYVCERSTAISHRFIELASRMKTTRFPSIHALLIGRIKLETWHTVRRERPLRCYDFGYATSTILGRPFPSLFVDSLMSLTSGADPNGRAIGGLHFLEMARCNLHLLYTLGVFVRTTQMAQLYGIQYTEVINRGSQFRVESMLLRIAKKSAFLPPSVSVEQRNRMGAPETIPLNLEPESGIYMDPVAVLDFQSLYPSVCIAYNYCFSTCLGKVSRLCDSGDQLMMRLGALIYERLDFESLRNLIENDEVHVAPTGCAFVKPKTQTGLLGSMLEELLDARVMIKKSMKRYVGDQKTYRQLDAQQLALKLVANTTYGYAAANWSGRMPCEEVAEAIVSKGREALERAIEHIQSSSDLYDGARVIYGDTDSIFVYFQGATRERAFELGRKIAEEVTAMNPHPMKLKFEKIMQPCVLLTKKRYVGHSYENLPDERPKFDAKGIEAVRRDCCPFVSKLMEKCLILLFERDVDAVLQFLRVRLRDLTRFPLSDFVINTEYRGHYAEHAVVPGKKIAQERSRRSERYAPLPGERLSYLIVRRRAPGEKSVRLITCVASLEEFLRDSKLQIYWNYYVNRPLFGALSRVLNMIPVHLHWHVVHSNGCYGCQEENKFPFCSRCARDIRVYQRLLIERSAAEQKRLKVQQTCKECLMPGEEGDVDFVSCANMRCPVAQKRLEVDRCVARKLVHKHKLYVLHVELS